MPEKLTDGVGKPDGEAHLARHLAPGGVHALQLESHPTALFAERLRRFSEPETDAPVRGGDVKGPGGGRERLAVDDDLNGRRSSGIHRCGAEEVEAHDSGQQPSAGGAARRGREGGRHGRRSDSS